MIAVLGIMQILAWGSSYYLLGVLAPVIATDTGWPLPWIVGGLAFGLMAAALVSPQVGRTIERHGGWPVLAASAVLFAAGLCGLAAAPGLPVYLATWFVLGLAMGAGLYDAAFATLGRLYGQGARQAITALIPSVLVTDRFDPVSGGDGSDLAGDGAEAVPGVAAGGDDGS